MHHLVPIASRHIASLICVEAFVGGYALIGDRYCVLLLGTRAVGQAVQAGRGHGRCNHGAITAPWVQLTTPLPVHRVARHPTNYPDICHVLLSSGL